MEDIVEVCIGGGRGVTRAPVACCLATPSPLPLSGCWYAIRLRTGTNMELKLCKSVKLHGSLRLDSVVGSS